MTSASRPTDLAGLLGHTHHRQSARARERRPPSKVGAPSRTIFDAIIIRPRWMWTIHRFASPNSPPIVVESWPTHLPRPLERGTVSKRVLSRGRVGPRCTPALFAQARERMPWPMGGPVPGMDRHCPRVHSPPVRRRTGLPERRALRRIRPARHLLTKADRRGRRVPGVPNEESRPWSKLMGGGPVARALLSPPLSFDRSHPDRVETPPDDQRGVSPRVPASPHVIAAASGLSRRRRAAHTAAGGGCGPGEG